MPPEQGEAVLRRQLAAAYRLVDYFGWTELIYGHLTARVPGYQPGQSDRSSASKRDDYRNYKGSLHSGPENNP